MKPEIDNLLGKIIVLEPEVEVVALPPLEQKQLRTLPNISQADIDAMNYYLNKYSPVPEKTSQSNS